MVPVRDPIKNIVFNAQTEDLKDVMIDGHWVQRDGTVLTVDQAAVARALQPAGERMWANIIETDWAHRTADQMSPQSLQPFEG
jgi:5-methylthioadenosine/S-adenosylhomocysteine deaminase